MNKKDIKKFIFRLLFLLEILVFGFTYLFGSNGISKLIKLKKENQSLVDGNLKIKYEILCIENQIKEWNSDSFNQEKIAREQLQLSSKDDEIYLLNNN